MKATITGHWPGKDTPVCDVHGVAMTNVAHAMGFNVSFTPCLEDV